IRPGIEPTDPVTEGVAGGEHQDREIGTRGPDPARHLEAADVGQPDVQDQRLDPRRPGCQGDRRDPIRGNLYHVSVLLEEAPQEPAEPLIIFDDKEVHGPPVSAAPANLAGAWFTCTPRF